MSLPVTADGYSIGVNPVYLTISISTMLEVYLTIIKIYIVRNKIRTIEIITKYRMVGTL